MRWLCSASGPLDVPLTTLKGCLLAAELNTAHDLTTLKGGLLAAELNTVYEFNNVFVGRSLVTAELNTIKARIG